VVRIARRNLLKGAGALMLAGGTMPLAMPALGQSAGSGKWPDKPIRFIVPLAPGGAIDFVARQTGEVLSRNLGQQVVVENRTGAGGTIGMDMAMRSTPDGYTILITNDNAASAPHILQLSYDYTKELVPLCDLGHQPQAFAVHPSLGVSSVKEYVENAKKSPGVGYATSGVGSNQHVVGAWFAQEAGIKLEHVPYRGAGQAVNDLIAGHVKSAFLGPTALIAHHKAGTIKIIGQTSAKRAPSLQDIPTIEESGYKGLVLEAWYAAFAPIGTPKDLVTQINAEFNKSLKDARLLDAFEKGSMEAIGGTPDALGKLAQTDSAKYARLVKELNIKVT
jgi:tripartite-type tricarboxylate transporter receptor subunit TctC